MKNPVSINQGPSVCLGFGCLASGHGDSQMCNEKRKPGSGQQQCLWERFKCSEHSGTNEKGCSLRRDEGRIGTPLWTGAYFISVCCMSSPRSWLWEPGCPTPISETSVFVSECPPKSGDGSRPPSPPIPQLCDRVGREQQNTPIIKT